MAGDVSHAWDLMEEIQTCMLVTHDGRNLRSRPMGAYVRRHEHAVGIGLLDRRMDDDSADGVAGLGTIGKAPRDPVVQIRPGVATVALQRNEAEAHVRDAGALGEEPRVAARRHAIPELQIDGVGIEVDALNHVLGARFHVARRDPRVDPRPPAHHGLDAVRADDDSSADGLLAVRPAQPDLPAAIGGARHLQRLGRNAQLGARGNGLGGQMRVEARPIENPPHVPLRHRHFGVVRGEENHFGDLARRPWCPVRIGELAQPCVPHPLGATHRGPDGPIPLDQQHVQVLQGPFRF